MTAVIAAVALVPLVALGLVLLRTWLDGRPPAPRTADRPPEQWIAPSVVVLHGVGAALTVVLVVVATVAG